MVTTIVSAISSITTMGDASRYRIKTPLFPIKEGYHWVWHWRRGTKWFRFCPREETHPTVSSKGRGRTVGRHTPRFPV